MGANTRPRIALFGAYPVKTGNVYWPIPRLYLRSGLSLLVALRTQCRATRMMEQFDLFAGRTLRDAGQRRVLSRNQEWMADCLREVPRVLPRLAAGGGDFTGEDLRIQLGPICGYPTHANAWGALVNVLQHQGLIQKTGTYRAMKTKASHARMTAVYRAAS
jgi:hypothetical protein